MTLVVYSAAALRDVDGIAALIAFERPAAAAKFLERLSELERLLIEHPEIGKETQRPGTRWLMLSGFPYQVYYRRLGADRIRIIRIRHARRRPLRWA